MDSKTVIKIMEAEGWYRVGQKGSHVQFKHPTKPGKTTVPHPRRDFDIESLKRIERQCGIKFRGR